MQKAENLGKKGLKLINEKKYTLESSGLNKLIFDDDNVRLFYNNSNLYIVDIKLSLDENTLDSKISINEYEKLIYPVYMLKGRLRDYNGFLAGVIHPRILDYNGLLSIIPEENPTFHFYLNKSNENYRGRSVNKKDKRLVAELMKDNNNLKEDEITPSFIVGIDPVIARIVFFEK
jgi:hypothetical protein